MKLPKLPKLIFERDKWSERAKIASSFITSNSVVVDLGAGRNVLYQFLKTPKLYIPVDALRRTKQTIVSNLEIFKAEDLKPYFKKLEVNFIVCLGTIEYIHNKKHFIEEATKIANTFVLSVALSPNLRKEAALESVIKNEEELIKLITPFGWKIVEKKVVKDPEYVFLLRRI